ncbi:hypothetical protein VTN02DRAFT_6462 [Thermoascus thermophilus]
MTTPVSLPNSTTPDTEPRAVCVTKNAHSTPGVTLITLNRPHRRNAIDGPTGLKLTLALRAFEADDTQKVAVLHGAGGCFCAGFDLHELSTFPGQDRAPGGEEDGKSYKGPRVGREQRVQGKNGLGPIGPSRMTVAKPVIAAVAGYAVAGGLELSLVADLRVAEEDAVFGVFCRRFGVPLVDGGTVRLPAIVGLGRALDLILTGRGVAAKEALEMGLANRVVPKGKSLDEALRMAAELVKFPQVCMNADRRSAYYSTYGARSFEDALAFEYDNGVPVIDVESVKGAGRFSAGAGRHGSFKL